MCVGIRYVDNIPTLFAFSRCDALIPLVFSSTISFLLSFLHFNLIFLSSLFHNPLGVEYMMLGEKEGFVAGMETTILLTTINRIGGRGFDDVVLSCILSPYPLILPH